MNKAEGKALGPLEAEIMDLIWQEGRCTIKKIHRSLSQQREIAYTTVMTTMNRLWIKGVLSRQREGMAYVYTPQVSRSEFGSAHVARLVDGLLDEYGQAGAATIRECLARRGVPVELTHG